MFEARICGQKGGKKPCGIKGRKNESAREYKFYIKGEISEDVDEEYKKRSGYLLFFCKKVPVDEWGRGRRKLSGI